MDENTLQSIAYEYFAQKKFNRTRLKNYKYDLAILVNPEESNPPSNSIALEKFRLAGERQGFFVEFITKDDIHRINEFDALFIRETTSVNDHTYQIARYAHAEGLIVIDDPWSILKCANKFYLQERMKRAKIKMPKNVLLKTNLENLSEAVQELKFPIVLKQPDSAFSLGVHKIDDDETLLIKAKALFLESEFIIAQEFLVSEYDWRVGILDNKVIFVCRYYMAKNHWQIYNWSGEEADDITGDSETVPIEDVPEIVINTALKATSFIGDGLYGVDLKYCNNQIYLIEINDNPNIDAGIEDFVAGDALYDTIIRSFKERILKARNINKYIDL
jgi:glutathione synthase/RimK-type ligase-like ATP-grasp enzyme